MKRRRVKITGIGPVTPAGIGKDEFWRGILEPVSRVRIFPKLDEALGPFVAAYIDEFDVTRFLDSENIPKRPARHTLFALVAASLALRDAGISKQELQESNCAVVTGSAMMDFGGIVNGIDSVSQKGARGAKPWLIQSVAHGCVANTIIDVLDFSARTMAVSNQCCSGIDAIAFGATLIADGAADIVICGGTEAPLHRSPLVEFRAAGLTPANSEMVNRLARPFDLWRTTGVIGEGAGLFVLEPENAKRTGYSFITGYGSAHDDPNDLCSGLTITGRLATAEAGIRTSDIDVISAWGPGHKQIDKGEAKAMRALFGADLERVFTGSIKASIGTPLGAAPAIQVAAAALAQRHGVVPPTAGWKYPDPECSLSISNKAIIYPHRITLVNSHGLGAVNGSMTLERC